MKRFWIGFLLLQLAGCQSPQDKIALFMIPFAILASVSILAALYSYREGHIKGDKAGNYAAQSLNELIAERNGWFAAYHGLLDSYVPQDIKEDAIKRAAAPSMQPGMRVCELRNERASDI
jgi:hypothetical protein